MSFIKHLQHFINSLVQSIGIWLYLPFSFLNKLKTRGFYCLTVHNFGKLLVVRSLNNNKEFIILKSILINTNVPFKTALKNQDSSMHKLIMSC